MTLEQHQMEYLYSDGSDHHFMNIENYEQIEFHKLARSDDGVI